MSRARQLTLLAVSDADSAQLQGVADLINVPNAFVRHASIVLAGADGLMKLAVVRRGFGTGGRNVTQAIRDGASKAHTPSFVPADGPLPSRARGSVIKCTFRVTSANATRWITRSMDEFGGLSASTMSNWFHLCGVTTHLTKTIKLSGDATLTVISAGCISMRWAMRWHCPLTRFRRSRPSTWNTAATGCGSWLRCGLAATLATDRRRCCRCWTSSQAR